MRLLLEGEREGGRGAGQCCVINRPVNVDWMIDVVFVCLLHMAQLLICCVGFLGRIISDHATPFGRRIRSAFATHVLLLEYALIVASVLLQLLLFRRQLRLQRHRLLLL